MTKAPVRATRGAVVRRFRHRRRLARKRRPRACACRPATRRERRLGRVRGRVACRLPSGDGSGAPWPRVMAYDRCSCIWKYCGRWPGAQDCASTQRSSADLNAAWHRLRPWPDSVAGLARLKRRFVIGTLSNGNMSLLIDLARAGRLPWDVILSAELFRHYKPDREVYVGAAALLGLPREIGDAGRRAQGRPRGRATLRLADCLCPPSARARERRAVRRKPRSTKRFQRRRFCRSRPPARAPGAVKSRNRIKAQEQGS